jgi:hypothetical protein
MLAIQVVLDGAERNESRPFTVPESAQVLDLIDFLLKQFGINAPKGTWELWHAKIRLASGSTLHGLKLDESTVPLTLTLRKAPRVDPSLDQADLFADLAVDDSEILAMDGSEILAMECPEEIAADDCEFDLLLADESPAVDSLAESEEVDKPRSSEPKTRGRAGSAPRCAMVESRRATVRYYDRMNPERLFPLLVTLTKDMVARVDGVQQISSGPFEVDRTAAIEVEPILPGCACYPSKATARLDRGDLKLTFYVVPQVLGTIEGAKIVVSQNHKSLAEMPLQIKVVKKTWVYVLSAASLVLPLATSLAKHFGLDFTSQHERGFDLYLNFARALIGLSPLMLTVGLLGLAAVAYWFLRPRARDCFWDVKVLKPDEMLQQIHQRMASEPTEAAHDLVDLLQAYPSYQPAFLLYGTWHYKWKNYQAALHGFEKAIALGPIKASQYHQAALAASRLGENRKALSICKEATTKLQRIPGAIWFNMGCYHARLDELDLVVLCLQKAIAAGFRKVASFREDPDLAPVRNRPEFRSLLDHPALAGQP